ncbi:MAG: glycoside hydrolase/phage tail family protein [Paracoccus sp. (in: a-proteobacteria)]|nr:glycoside hydrolase/phage tail family protein [Paracoccus sp. (in: a-proteobacteria)]
MATILLSAVGASVGAGFGGAVLGLSGAVIGRAVGATIGRALDQRLLGGGSQAVETGGIDRLRLQTAGEGLPIPVIWGQMRVAGHVIWAAPLKEMRARQGGGKGMPRITNISYRLSVALALCEGEILGVGRVWADGEEIRPAELNMRVYTGAPDQLPDPVIAAHEGEEAPAYRGTAYVVLDELDLERWGNRLPQLSFEVTRPAQSGGGVSREVQAVAMIPGTGEYALATEPVRYDSGMGDAVPANSASPLAATDFLASMDILGRELPEVSSVALVVSWFGDDLRAGSCTLRPKVEHEGREGSAPWRSGGIGVDAAQEVARLDGRPIYGGTPSDMSVIAALREIARSGRRAVFYPFILMEQLAGNGRPDPWSEAADQPVMPWRGRITTDRAPGREGSTQGTGAALAEVERFFGKALPGDFVRDGGAITYRGPEEWSYRRFILHYAHLCALAGGVDSFLIGSEMRSLTQIMGPEGRFPAVEALRRLAGEVRAILGPATKISYAADWSEYFGYHPGGGDAYFHLDPLWADRNIDFIGIDNYMPLSDWRDGEDHLDAAWGRIDAPGYMEANIAGGEGFDWYYSDPEHRDAQIRTPIRDGAYGEDWVWRYKDLRGWWSHRHHNRIGGARQPEPTAWVPRSKPFWFTEMGCAAIDKGSNQPNKFLDAFSSESALPHYSSGRRDDAVQAAYLRAMTGYWGDPANNPPGADGRAMVDMSRAHVWCWDARPYPAFPGRADLWSDGPAWSRGHWLNGRSGAVPLSGVLADICAAAGITRADVSGVSGLVRGFLMPGTASGRAMLQPLMLAYGVDVAERGGKLRFTMRNAKAVAAIGAGDLAESSEGSASIIRAPEAELIGRVRVSHLIEGDSYAPATAEACLPDDAPGAASDSEIPLVLTAAEGRAMAARWLAEARVARDTLRLTLPPSRADLGPGDVIEYAPPGSEAGARRWRIDRIERAGGLTIDAVRCEKAALGQPPEDAQDGPAMRRYTPPQPVWPVFLDLPMMRGDEVPHAPHLAVAARPWPGAVAVYGSGDAEGGFELNSMIEGPSIIGRTLTPLAIARGGLIDRGAPLEVTLPSGALAGISEAGLLSGANLMAIGSGHPGAWELFQFRRAELIGPGRWAISERLRGQFGTDGVMPALWPPGSTVVLLDGSETQVDLPPALLHQSRIWRIGPALREVTDSSHRQLNHAFAGTGLRPYAPCHLRLDGARLHWMRRTRLGGERWDLPDVPLSEAREAYLVRLSRAGEVIHEAHASQPSYQLPGSLVDRLRAEGGPVRAEVAQLSAEFGYGPFIRREFHV